MEQAARPGGAEEDPPEDDGTTCCGGRSVRIELTSPMTNQPVAGNMTPNRTIDNQICEMIAKGTSRASPEELEAWHGQRDEKERKDSERVQLERELEQEEARSQEQARIHEEAAQERDRTPSAAWARVVGRPHRIRSARRRQALLDSFPFEHTGLASALVPTELEADEFQTDFLMAWKRVRLTFRGHCQISACSQSISATEDTQQCLRCGRVVCESCRSFGVTQLEQGEHVTNSEGEVCGECVMDMVSRLSHENTDSLVLHQLKTERLPAWFDNLLRTRIANQAKVVERQVEAEFAPIVADLEQQIANQKLEKARLHDEARRLRSLAAEVSYRLIHCISVIYLLIDFDL